MEDASIVSGQAEQDQFWMAWDEWYADAPREELLFLVEMLGSGQRLSRKRRRVVDSLALHMIRELALRSHAKESEE